jgi:endonuclease/exonuclease/phosphatase family metal-dependent hydrolase
MRRRLRVLTWNVGRLYSPTHNNRLDDADVPRVARVLGELHPDVVLLQELVDERQLQAILVRLHHEAGPFHGALAQKCGYDRKSAALVRSELAPAFEHDVLGETTRGVVTATFDLGDGSRGAAICAHFDVFNPVRRAEQGWALAALAEARAEPLVVAGGDLNLDPKFADASANREDTQTFARLTRELVDVGHAAGATLVGLLRVDHLFLRGGARHLARVSPRRLPLGDHHPLVLDVDLDPDVASTL